MVTPQNLLSNRIPIYVWTMNIAILQCHLDRVRGFQTGPQAACVLTVSLSSANRAVTTVSLQSPHTHMDTHTPACTHIHMNGHKHTHTFLTSRSLHKYRVKRQLQPSYKLPSPTLMFSLLTLFSTAGNVCLSTCPCGNPQPNHAETCQSCLPPSQTGIHWGDWKAAEMSQ